MHDLTAFQRDLLFVVVDLGDAHGLAIKDEIEEYYGTTIHHGRLYPNLDELAEKGLVEKGKKDERTNSYAPTARGRREIEDRLDWQRGRVDEDTLAA